MLPTPVVWSWHELILRSRDFRDFRSPRLVFAVDALRIEPSRNCKNSLAYILQLRLFSAYVLWRTAVDNQLVFSHG